MSRPIITAAMVILLPLGALAGEQSVTLAMENMTCVLCPITVTRAIERVDGVLRVSVNYEARRATVRYDDARTTWQRIAEAATNAGYPARRIDR